MDTSTILPLAVADLACYCMAVYPGFQMANHHRALIDALEAVERGELRRLIIAMPPRHGKSLTATQLFPSWYLGRHPDRSIIGAAYGADLAEDFGRKVRNLLSDPIHRAIFLGCELSADSAAQKRFETTKGGSAYFVGRGGPITGRGAHLLLIDDPLKDAEEARSETIRRALIEWYTSVAFTRLFPDAAVVLIQTRWHTADLAGWLLSEHKDQNWHVLSMPAIAEQDEPFRKKGEALWPERYPLQLLSEIRQAVGSLVWASLYQQRPVADGGTVFKSEWWQRYSKKPDFRRIVQSWDTAFKSGTENDYSVCTTWGEANNGFYLLSVWKQRVEFPQLKRQLVAMATEWKPDAVLIEDKASGQSLIQELKQGTSLPLIPVKVDSDKIARAQAVTPLVEAGRVFLPESASWIAEFLDEMSAFPAGAHDDSVDSTTQALNYMRQSTYGLFELWRQQAEELRVQQSAPQSPVQAATTLAAAQKTDSAVFGNPKPKPAPVIEAKLCPECSSAVARYGEGRWKCNVCGEVGQDAVKPEKQDWRR